MPFVTARIAFAILWPHEGHLGVTAGLLAEDHGAVERNYRF